MNSKKKRENKERRIYIMRSASGKIIGSQEEKQETLSDKFQKQLDEIFKQNGTVFKQGMNFNKDLIPQEDEYIFFQVDNYDEKTNLCDCNFEFKDNIKDILPCISDLAQQTIDEAEDELTYQSSSVYSTLLSLSADDEVKFQVNLTFDFDNVWLNIPLNNEEQGNLIEFLEKQRDEQLTLYPDRLDAFIEDYER